MNIYARRHECRNVTNNNEHNNMIKCWSRIFENFDQIINIIMPKLLHLLTMLVFLSRILKLIMGVTLDFMPYFSNKFKSK